MVTLTITNESEKAVVLFETSVMSARRAFHVVTAAASATPRTTQIGMRSRNSVVRENARNLGFDMAEKWVGASTDLGNLSQAVPTVSYTLPTCPPGVGMHTREALDAGASELGLRGMMNDARVMVTAAIDLLASAEILETVRADFRRGT